MSAEELLDPQYKEYVAKHLQRAFAPGDGRLLVFDTKYDNEYYLIETEADVRAACLDQIRERANMGYFYEPRPATGSAARIIPKEEIDALPEGVVRNTAIAHNKNVRSDESRYKQDLLEYQLFVLAIGGDSDAAVYLVMQRDGYEYEGFSVEKVRNR